MRHNSIKAAPRLQALGTRRPPDLGGLRLIMMYYVNFPA